MKEEGKEEEEEKEEEESKEEEEEEEEEEVVVVATRTGQTTELAESRTREITESGRIGSRGARTS